MAGHEIVIDEVVHFDVTTRDPETGAISDADATPTWKVYEEDTDTSIVNGNMTKRTDLTGRYRGSFTASAANGFEVGKFYNVEVAATVNSVSDAVPVLLLYVRATYPGVNLVQILATTLTESTGGWIAAAFKKLFNVETPALVASDVMRGTDGANTTVPDAAGTASTLIGDLETHGDNAWATATGFSTHSAADVWSVSVRTLTSFGALASDVATAVWAAGTRTLSSFGTLVADVATAVWGAAIRTLTAFGFEVTTDSASRTASKADVSGIEAVTDKLDTMVEADGLNYKYTADALQEAPTGGGDAPTVEEIDAELTDNHGSGSWQQGTGASATTLKYVLTLPPERTGTPVSGAQVWACSDEAGESILPGAIGVTNADGMVWLLIDRDLLTDSTVYLFRSCATHGFTNPDVEVLS